MATDITDTSLTPTQRAEICERQAAHRLLQAEDINQGDERHRAVVDEAKGWALLGQSHRLRDIAEELGALRENGLPQ